MGVMALFHGQRLREVMNKLLLKMFLMFLFMGVPLWLGKRN
jgi:hypothetical protein